MDWKDLASGPLTVFVPVDGYGVTCEYIARRRSMVEKFMVWDHENPFLTAPSSSRDWLPMFNSVAAATAAATFLGVAPERQLVLRITISPSAAGQLRSAGAVLGRDGNFWSLRRADVMRLADSEAQFDILTGGGELASPLGSELGLAQDMLEYLKRERIDCVQSLRLALNGPARRPELAGVTIAPRDLPVVAVPETAASV